MASLMCAIVGCFGVYIALEIHASPNSHTSVAAVLNLFDTRTAHGNDSTRYVGDRSAEPGKHAHCKQEVKTSCRQGGNGKTHPR